MDSLAMTLSCLQPNSADFWRSCVFHCIVKDNFQRHNANAPARGYRPKDISATGLQQ
jgi:hypothetical protein